MLPCPFYGVPPGWDGDPPPPPDTIETAEAALGFLVEEGMIEVAGDQLIVPAHFLPEDLKTPVPAT